MKITSSNMGGGTKAGVILLFIVLGACLLTIVGLAIAVGVYRNKLRACRVNENRYKSMLESNGTEYCDCESTGGTTVSPSSSLCESPECYAIAGEVISRMDRTVQPCDDFYKYACGLYDRPENRPPDQAVLQTFDLPQQRVQQLLYQTLTSNSSNFRGAPSTAVQKAKDYFNSCLHSTVDDTTGAALLKQLYTYNPFGPSGQPTLNLEDTLASIHSLDIDGIVGLNLEVDPRNTSTYILTIEPATLTLVDPAAYKKPGMEQLYKNYVTEVMTIMFDGPANYSDLGSMLWSLESAIANVYPSAADLANSATASNIMKLSSLQSQVPFLNLTTLVNKILQSSGATVSDDTDILVVTPAYFASLVGVLTGLGANLNTALASYLGWTVYNTMLPYAGPSLRDAYAAFYSTVSGAQSQSNPLWKTCLEETLEVAELAVGAAYTDAQVNSIDVQNVGQILQKQKEDLIVRLASVDWMQDTVKQRAQANANALSWQIGFPQYIDTAAKLDQYYSDLNVSGNHFQNAVAGRRFQVKSDIQEYGKPVDTSDWERNPTDTYSYYNPATNQVLVQAGLLQKPMYDRSYPLGFNYGGLGSILGQKMMMLYGFRDKWWDQNTTDAYNTRAKCFIDQYNKESFHGISVDGTQTSVENIADTEGLKIAYDAYMKAASAGDKSLPGLNLSGAQQFFLGFTQLGCSNFDPSRVGEVVQSGHVPSPIRVKVLLQNTPEFSQAFQCPDRSNMKLSDSSRCRL